MKVLLLFISLLFADSFDILSDIYSISKWDIVDISNNRKIFEAQNNSNNDKFIKVEGTILDDKESILDVVESIPDYNNIISNKNVTTDFLYSDNDTLFCYQKISNFIPFIRDRQYIFKMYRVNNHRVDWYLVNKNHSMLKPYLHDDIRTITYGAGSWEIQNSYKKILIYRMYIDEEVNLPLSFIQKMRVNHVLNIFNDVINWSKGDK